MHDRIQHHGEAEDQAAAPLLTVTPQAHKNVQEIRASEPDGGKLALWLAQAAPRGTTTRANSSGRVGTE